jgi:hypothetical protein
MEEEVGRGGTVHKTCPAEEETRSALQSCPHTLILFKTGSACRLAKRPGWVKESWQPPAKEQVTFESI